MRKQHKNNAHLNCKSDICEKTASSEKFRLEIDLNFLENVNVLIVDQPPCYRSSIEDSIRLGVSNQHKTQALNYLRTKTISFCRKLGLNYANKITCKNLSNTVTPQIPVSSEIIFCTSHLAATSPSLKVLMPIDDEISKP